jgi:hypothetical protein
VDALRTKGHGGMTAPRGSPPRSALVTLGMRMRQPELGDGPQPDHSQHVSHSAPMGVPGATTPQVNPVSSQFVQIQRFSHYRTRNPHAKRRDVEVVEVPA